MAASPHDEIADTHWYRPDVDHFLVKEAEQHGAVYLDEVTLEHMTVERDGVRLDGHRADHALQLSARFVIDASGPRGFLQRLLDLAGRPHAVAAANGRPLYALHRRCGVGAAGWGRHTVSR